MKRPPCDILIPLSARFLDKGDPVPSVPEVEEDMIDESAVMVSESEDGAQPLTPQQPQNEWRIRDSNYQKPQLNPQPRSARRNKRGITLGQGTVQLKRRTLILEIVEKCGGAFPGDGEMTQVYQRQQKHTETTTPDRDTIFNAVKNLIDRGELKKISYAFRDDKGQAVTKSVLLLPTLDLKSGAAQKLMKQSQETHPQTFIPAPFTPPPIQRPPQNKNISR